MDLISDHTFWPINSGLIRSYPSLNADLECEVLVLGAGITGALCAFHLTKAGMDVAVMDKRDVASGSTSASTAMLQYEIDTPLTELIAKMGKADAERSYHVCLDTPFRAPRWNAVTKAVPTISTTISTTIGPLFDSVCACASGKIFQRASTHGSMC